MERNQTLNAVVTAGRVVIGLTFGTAGVLKLIDLDGFVSDIRHYDLVGEGAARIVASYLPWLELVCALALLLRWRERAAAALITALCGAFALLTAITWIRGVDVTCGCFGRATGVAHPALVIGRDVLLGSAAVCVARGPRTTRSRVRRS